MIVVGTVVKLGGSPPYTILLTLAPSKNHNDPQTWTDTEALRVVRSREYKIKLGDRVEDGWLHPREANEQPQPLETYQQTEDYGGD